MLLNIGHGPAMVEIGTGFRAYHHDKAEANQIFYGSPWRLLWTWRVVVAKRWRRKYQTKKRRMSEK